MCCLLGICETYRLRDALLILLHLNRLYVQLLLFSYRLRNIYLVLSDC